MLISATRLRTWLPYGLPLMFLCMISGPATAAMYRCYDATGSQVLTDSPAQLEDCTVLDLKKPTAQMAPSTPRASKRVSRPRPRRTPSSPQRGGPPLQEELSQDQTKNQSPDNQIEPITVPITKIGGSIVVQVLLNGSVDAHLILDTGATMTVLSYDLGIELGLLSGSDVSLNTVNTAGGSVQVSMTTVNSIHVGSAKASHVAVAIHDLPDAISGVSGLLGMSFLKNFEVTLDADRGLLRLLPKSKK